MHIHASVSLCESLCVHVFVHVSACICTCSAGSKAAFLDWYGPEAARILSRGEEGAGLQVAYEPHTLGSLGESPKEKLRFQISQTDL